MPAGIEHIIVVKLYDFCVFYVNHGYKQKYFQTADYRFECNLRQASVSNREALVQVLKNDKKEKIKNHKTSTNLTGFGIFKVLVFESQNFLTKCSASRKLISGSIVESAHWTL